MQRSNMPVQAVLLAWVFFFLHMFYLHKYSSKLEKYITPLHVSKFICAIMVKSRSVSLSGVHVIFLQVFVHWDSKLQGFWNRMWTYADSFLWKNCLNYKFCFLKCAHNQYVIKSTQRWMWSVIVAQKLWTLYSIWKVLKTDFSGSNKLIHNLFKCVIQIKKEKRLVECVFLDIN